MTPPHYPVTIRAVLAFVLLLLAIVLWATTKMDVYVAGLFVLTAFSILLP